MACAYNPNSWEAEAGEFAKFQVNLGYIVRPYLNKTKQQNSKTITTTTKLKQGGEKEKGSSERREGQRD